MTIYDRDGLPIDMAALTLDELNDLMRESIDMMRRKVLLKHDDEELSEALMVLNVKAVDFTNVLYRDRMPLGWEGMEVVT